MAERGNLCVGVVSEFDPFHLGHQYLLGEVRRLRPGWGIVCAMSGHFTQRGSAASLSKHARAEMALLGGADLVLELPVLWSSASAETFARGGIQCLLGTGVVEAIAFGSESGEIAPLREVAAALESPRLQPLLRAGLGEGLSYAAARQRGAEQLLGERAALLGSPNNTLGIEYLRALDHCGRADVEAITVPRRGEGHNSPESGSPMVSASLLRRWMGEGRWEKLERSLPAGSLAVLRRALREGEGPASLERCALALLGRLRAMGEADYRALPDYEPGLEHRLARAAGESLTLAEFYDKAKTRRIPEARVRRMALWAFLNLREADRPEAVPYLRVLGCNERGRAILREMKARALLPVLTKPGQVRELGGEARRVFQLESRATDLWRLTLPEGGDRLGGREWLRGPVVL